MQELHAGISDATAKRGEEIRTNLKAIPVKLHAVMASVKESLGAQEEETRKQLSQAFAYLESMEKHVAASLANTGHACESSVRHAVADAHAAALNVSEAVATQRSPAHVHG